MLRARLFASLLAVTTAVTTTSAQAQTGSLPDRERTAKARKAYDEGKAAYSMGQYDRAIEHWKRGYEYKDDPIFLVNIGHGYHQKGDPAKALFYYKAFLKEDPQAANREEIEERVAELEAVVPAQPEAPTWGREPPSPEAPTRVERTDPPVAAATPPDAPPIQDEGPERPGRGMKIGGLVTGGVGLAVTTVGTIFLLRSLSIESEIEDAAAAQMPWSGELVDREAEGKSARTIGILGVSVGAACLLGGVMLFYSGARKDAQAVREYSASWRIAPVVGAGRAAVSVTVTF